MRDPEEMRGSHRSNGGATGTSSQKAGAFALYSRYGILLTVARHTAHGGTAQYSREHVMANPIVAPLRTRPWRIRIWWVCIERLITVGGNVAARPRRSCPHAH